MILSPHTCARFDEASIFVEGCKQRAKHVFIGVGRVVIISVSIRLVFKNYIISNLSLFI